MHFPKLFKFDKNYHELDIIRGIAVFIMIIAHVIAFTSDDSSQFLNIIRFIGDAFAFSIFLCVSGAVRYISGSNSEFKFQKRKFFRSLEVLLLYYVLVFIPYIKDGSAIKNFFQIIFFIKVPNFTEFLIPFILYGMIFYLFPHWLKALVRHYSVVIGIVIICLCSSYILYPIHINNEMLAAWKALFFGSEGLFRFPIVTYFPLFIAGAYFEKIYQQDKKRLIAEPMLAALLIVTIAYILLLHNFSRWPPSIGFLSAGIAMFILLFILSKYIKFGILNTLGRNPLYFLFIHLFILNIMDIWFYKNYNSTLMVLIIFISILLFAIILNQIINVYRERTKK